MPRDPNANPGHPFVSGKNAVLFIAEIGGNHGGNFEYAQQLNRLAIASGADVVKYQIYSGDGLVSPLESPERNAHFKRFELEKDDYLALSAQCESAGVQFMASTWDMNMLAWVDARVRMHKIGSGDLTCYPMLRRVAETGKPIILSTGLSTISEVRDAVAYIGSVDESYLAERKLALLQCTSSYPCADEDANVDAMLELRDRFGLPVGFSNHTEGSLAIETAVALGAEIIEAHITDTREGQDFRDHRVSLTCDEIQELLGRLRRIRSFKGDPVKQPTAREEAEGHVVSFRRSVYAARDIAVGERFDDENLTVLRPATGLPASAFESLVGRRAVKSLRKNEVLRDEHLG